MMPIRFRVAQLIREKEELERRAIPWREVSETTGISGSVLSSLASPRVGVTTNTRFIEALCRYFKCQPGELLELEPTLEEEPRCHVDELYPSGGAHR
ncbi:MAG: helix-turn-helix domain-containing protein [Planctomycetia bacterium]|nr:helix-turn-helix domain-containing protein [Planctomycetia bacterium]